MTSEQVDESSEAQIAKSFAHLHSVLQDYNGVLPLGDKLPLLHSVSRCFWALRPSGKVYSFIGVVLFGNTNFEAETSQATMVGDWQIDSRLPSSKEKSPSRLRRKS